MQIHLTKVDVLKVHVFNADTVLGKKIKQLADSLDSCMTFVGLDCGLNKKPINISPADLREHDNQQGGKYASHLNTRNCFPLPSEIRTRDCRIAAFEIQLILYFLKTLNLFQETWQEYSRHTNKSERRGKAPRALTLSEEFKGFPRCSTFWCTWKLSHNFSGFL